MERILHMELEDRVRPISIEEYEQLIVERNAWAAWFSNAIRDFQREEGFSSLTEVGELIGLPYSRWKHWIRPANIEKGVYSPIPSVRDDKDNRWICARLYALGLIGCDPRNLPVMPEKEGKKFIAVTQAMTEEEFQQSLREWEEFQTQQANAENGDVAEDNGGPVILTGSHISQRKSLQRRDSVQDENAPESEGNTFAEEAVERLRVSEIKEASRHSPPSAPAQQTVGSVLGEMVDALVANFAQQVAGQVIEAMGESQLRQSNLPQRDGISVADRHKRILATMQLLRSDMARVIKSENSAEVDFLAKSTGRLAVQLIGQLQGLVLDDPKERERRWKFNQSDTIDTE